MAWLSNIFNRVLNVFRKWWQRWVRRRFLKSIESEAAEEFLKLLLRLMSLTFQLDKDFGRNIDGFKGRYLFRTIDNSVTVAAIFTGRGLKVKEKLIPDPDVSVVFKDRRSLMDYLLATDRDILKLVLNNEVVLKGNMNYIFKFGYMANHIQLSLAGKLP